MRNDKITRARRLIQQNDEQINARLVLDDAGFDRLWNALRKDDDEQGTTERGCNEKASKGIFARGLGD